MTTSGIITGQSKAGVDATRPPAGYSYMRARNKLRAFALVNKDFEKANITQAELARRLGKRPDRVSRLLNAPGNWTLDTVSDLLFAISGGEVKYEVAYPRPNLDAASGNGERRAAVAQEEVPAAPSAT